MTETQLEFISVLDSCIEDVKAGRLTVEACLDRYPEFASELRDPLIAANMLRGVSPVKPSEAFRQKARPQLMAKLGPMPAGGVSLIEALRQKWTHFTFIPQTRRFSMAWMLALILVASVLVGGGTAYASDAAVPGQPLYGLDRSLEEIQSKRTHDPEAYVALQLAFADERLSEAHTLAGDAESEEFQEALDGYGETIAAIAQKVGSAEGIDLAALGALLDEALSNHDAQLTGLTALDDEDDGADDCDVNVEEDCDENDDIDDDDVNGDVDDGDKIENWFCANGESHPVALKLAGELYDAETIMGWFCGSGVLPGGFGFGQIMHAIQTQKLLADQPLEIGEEPTTAEDLLAMKAGGMGWGQIWQFYNLKGKSTVDDDLEDTELSEDDLRPEAPGQVKKSDGQVPPGQVKKADQQEPPRQAKKSDGQVPPGQAKKSDQQEPSNQDEEPDQPEPSEQGNKSENPEPPGQAKKSNQQEPPGQAKKADQQEPPGQAKKSDQQQGKKGNN